MSLVDSRYDLSGRHNVVCNDEMLGSGARDEVSEGDGTDQELADGGSAFERGANPQVVDSTNIQGDQPTGKAEGRLVATTCRAPGECLKQILNESGRLRKIFKQHQIMS